MAGKKQEIETKPSYLGINEVCEFLGISRRTLERYRAPNLPESPKDRIPFIEPSLHIRKSPRWNQKELVEWLKVNGPYLKNQIKIAALKAKL